MLARKSGVVFAAVLIATPGLVLGQGVPRGEAARGTTVLNRERADFDPIGVRLGAFRANAAAELGIGYDDNIFGTRRRTSDGYGILAAEGDIRSDWSRHAVGGSASVEQRRYWSETEQNWTDYSVGLFGRYDVNADTNVEARLNRVQEHLDTFSIDVQEADLARPVPYAYTEAQVQATTRFNRIGLTGIINYRDYSFEDVEFSGPPPAPGAADPGRLSRFNFESWIGAVGVSYQLSPGRFVNLIGRYQDIRYEEAAQSGRNSKTWEGLVGFTYDFDGIYAVRAAVGYRQRDYEGAGIRSLSGPAFEGELTYQPTLLTTLRLSGRRTIEESIRNNAVSYVRTQAAFNVDHEYLRNVILGVELQLDRREYEQPTERATDGVAILSARWLINRNLSLVGSYQHVRRLDNSTGVEEYDRNLVQVRLRVAL